MRIVYVGIPLMDIMRAIVFDPCPDALIAIDSRDLIYLHN